MASLLAIYGENEVLYNAMKMVVVVILVTIRQLSAQNSDFEKFCSLAWLHCTSKYMYIIHARQRAYSRGMASHSIDHTLVRARYYTPTCSSASIALKSLRINCSHCNFD